MKIVYTHQARPDDLGKFELEQVYNGIDSCETHEIDSALEEHMDDISRHVYKFELRQQRAALLMMRRGLRVDLVERSKLINELSREKASLEAWLNEIGAAVWDRDINARSPSQLKQLLYECMKMPGIYSRDKFTGEQKLTTNREALEQLIERSYFAPPVINAILAIRDVSKILSTVKSDVRGGRFYTTFNVAGTSTGRWSSKKDAFGSGSNAQNLTKDIRCLFIADPGMMLGACDLSQAESFATAYISQDLNYIEACESGDLHTTCARMLWPNLPWIGELKQDKSLAEEPYFRHFSRRDLSKRGGHLSNYVGKPFTMSSQLRLPLQLCKNFQSLYFSRFSRIPEWWDEVEREIIKNKFLITPMNRRRYVFERKGSDDTLRKLVAFLPQSTVADIMDEGICRVAEELDQPNYIEILLQVHDCLLFQFPDRDYDAAIRVRDKLMIPVSVNSRTMLIPCDLKVGYDWKNMVSLDKADSLQRPEYNLLDVELVAET